VALEPSNAARSQAYITRARIGILVYTRIVFYVLIAWAALTVYVVWLETNLQLPQLGHQYFWRWVIGNILTGTPLLDTLAPWLPMYAGGRLWELLSFTAWLNGPGLYQAPFGNWFWHYGLRTAVLPLSIAGGAAFWRLRHMVNVEHLRGLQLLTVRQHNRQLNGSWVQRSYRKAIGEPDGIRLGNVVLPRAMECDHFLLTGNTHSGKTTLARHLIYQLRERGEAAIINDPDGELVREFLDESLGDIVLCPVDRRCPFFSPWGEIRSEFKSIDAAALAASIVRGRPTNDTQEYFQRNARALVRGMFEAIPVEDRDNLEVFADFLKQTRDKIRTQLENTSAPAAVIDPGAHDSGGGQGIIGVVDTAIEGFSYLPRREQTSRTWSARTWAANPKGIIFLTSDSTTRDAVQGMQGIFVDCLSRWLSARPFGSPQVWIIIEEAPAMGYMPQLKEIAARGRKRDLSLVLIVQSVSQLREIYGHDGALSLISQPSTKIILRVDETEMAEWASHQLGEREVQRLQMAQLAGVNAFREGMNLQPQQVIERVVMADEIKLLKPLSGYIAIAGHDRCRISIDELRMVERQPAFLPRISDSKAPPTAPTTATNAQWKTL
jgi:type IV secretory pathway TraG/TraD family ATPase VirD4